MKNILNKLTNGRYSRAVTILWVLIALRSIMTAIELFTLGDIAVYFVQDGILTWGLIIYGGYYYCKFHFLKKSIKYLYRDGHIKYIDEILDKKYESNGNIAFSDHLFYDIKRSFIVAYSSILWIYPNRIAYIIRTVHGGKFNSSIDRVNLKQLTKNTVMLQDFSIDKLISYKAAVRNFKRKEDEKHVNGQCGKNIGAEKVELSNVHVSGKVKNQNIGSNAGKKIAAHSSEQQNKNQNKSKAVSICRECGISFPSAAVKPNGLCIYCNTKLKKCKRCGKAISATEIDSCGYCPECADSWWKTDDTNVLMEILEEERYIGYCMVSEEDIRNIDELISENKKFEAIRFIIKLSNVSFEDAKKFINNYKIGANTKELLDINIKVFPGYLKHDIEDFT